MKTRLGRVPAWTLAVLALGVFAATPVRPQVRIIRNGKTVEDLSIHRGAPRPADGRRALAGDTADDWGAMLARNQGPLWAETDALVEALAGPLREAAARPGPTDPARIGRIRTSLNALLAREGAIAAAYAETQAFLESQGLAPEILERNVAAAERFQSFLDQLPSAVNRVIEGEPGAVDAALTLLGRTSPETEETALGPRPGSGEPADNGEDPTSELPVSAQLSPHPRNGGSEYLAPTPEIVFTPAIVAKAELLGHDPVRIYEFVRNAIAHEIYPGSRKGAAETLRQGAGNDTDQASLLIALFRVSGIPARYVQASIAIPVDAFQSWFQSRDVDFTRAILGAEGMNGSRITNAGGDTIAVVKTHAYVEAYVPYGRYRGTRNHDAEPVWLALDPSFTQHDIRDGADYVGDMGFDVNAFFATHVSIPTPLTPINVFENDIQAWLDANQPGTMVTDGLRVATPIPQTLGLLPASLPYDVITVNARYASLFDYQRYWIRFELVGIPGILLDHTVRLSDLAGTSVVLDYIGATHADRDTIAAYGGIFNTPPNLVNLLARVKVNGSILATGVVPIGAARDATLFVHFTPPNGGAGYEPQNTYAVIAGNPQAWSFDTYQDRPADPDFSSASTPDALIESMLTTTVAGYQRLRNDGIRRLVPLLGASVQYDVRPNRALSAVQVSYTADQPTAMTWQGLLVDIDERNRWVHDAALRTGLRPNSFAEVYGGLDGLQSSVLEHLVFQEVFGRNAVSTVKILQIAAAQGIPLCTITASIGADCPGFSHPPEVAAEVGARLADNRTVTIPRDPVTVQDWTGTGYTALRGGGGAYLIQGGLAGPIHGGATVDEWEEHFPFIGCPASTLSAAILDPPQDAPNEKALFRAAHQPLRFSVALESVCDAGVSTQRLEFTTNRTAFEMGAGSYEFQILGAIRKFAILDGDLRIDSDNDGWIDEQDDSVETDRPFQFWVNDDANGVASMRRVFSPGFEPTLTVGEWDSTDDQINGIFDLMDLAPIGIQVDAATLQALFDLGVHLELRSTWLQYFRSSRANTLDGWLSLSGSYWFGKETGENQVRQPRYGDGGADGTLALDLADFDGTNRTWLVFEGQEPTTPETDTIRLVAYGPHADEAVVLDEVRIELKHLKDMYRSVSVRGPQTSALYETERLEDDGPIRTVTVDQFPTSFSSDHGALAQDADHVLVFVHGFNNTANAAEVIFQDVFRKLYLNGYRGDLVGYKWAGDEDDGLSVVTGFDLNVQNAFQSSKGLMNLIQELKADGKTIDIAAHSLGNLVVLDALRRLALAAPSVTFVRHVIHIEAAVWNGLYLGRPLPDGDDYFYRQADQCATWDHWAADVPFQVSGTIVNSYNAWDFALVAMTGNDAVKPRIRFPGLPFLFFADWAVTQPYRTPLRLAFQIPGNPSLYHPSTWRSPMGTEPIPQDHFTQKNFDTQDYDWDYTSHSDHHDLPLHRMWLWYRDVLLEHVGSGD